MKVKYWNEYTGETFNTEEEAIASEKKYLEAQEAKKRAEEEKAAAKKKKESERAARAKEVQEALNTAVEARKDYQKKLAAFCKDYGAFHFSTNDVAGLDLSSILDLMEDW